VIEKTNIKALEEIAGIREKTKVLLLGTFHFAFPRHDALKPEAKLDMLSPEKQAEVEEVVRLLSEFRPTKIAVEARLEQDTELNRNYQAYRAGAFPLRRGEMYQLGFRLAALLNHDRLYPIDEWGRWYEPEEKLYEYARNRLGRAGADLSEDELYSTLFEDLKRGYEKLYRHDEQHMLQHTLREHLLYLNSVEHITVNHGSYLAWVDSAPGDYTLPDYVTGWWYNRNLRIFANLKRITASTQDRILVIYGAGHIPILQHAVRCSPKHELVEVAEYLSQGQVH
jgi:hypothetical protein